MVRPSRKATKKIEAVDPIAWKRAESLLNLVKLAAKHTPLLGLNKDV